MLGLFWLENMRERLKPLENTKYLFCRFWFPLITAGTHKRIWHNSFKLHLFIALTRVGVSSKQKLYTQKRTTECKTVKASRRKKVWLSLLPSLSSPPPLLCFPSRSSDALHPLSGGLSHRRQLRCGRQCRPHPSHHDLQQPWQCQEERPPHLTRQCGLVLPVCQR